MKAADSRHKRGTEGSQVSRRAFSNTCRQRNEADHNPQEWRLPIAASDLDENGCAQINFSLPDAAPLPPAWRDAAYQRIARGLESLRIAENARAAAPSSLHPTPGTP
jgi:hypothetical protein